MSENYSVRVLIATLEDVQEHGLATLSHEELMGILETMGGPTQRAADGFTAEEISQIRRIARDVASVSGE